jgi:hypothetical protein
MPYWAEYVPFSPKMLGNVIIIPAFDLINDLRGAYEYIGVNNQVNITNI